MRLFHGKMINVGNIPQTWDRRAAIVATIQPRPDILRWQLTARLECRVTAAPNSTYESWGSWGSWVQQALADAQRQRQQLASALTKIDQLLSPTPPAFAQWQAHYFSDEGLQTRLNRALKHHVSLWQERLRQCDLMPGGGQS